MRFPRMTTRRWMVVVIVVAALLSATEGLRRRRSAFLERSGYYWGEAYGTSDELPPLPERWKHWTPFRPGPPAPLTADELAVLDAWKRSNAQRLAHEVAMYQKYEHAARYPWLPVEPDPPKPE